MLTALICIPLMSKASSQSRLSTRSNNSDKLPARLTARSYTEFDKFPGRLIDGRYEYPTLYTEDMSGRIRHWKIIIRAISAQAPQITDVNWNPASNAAQCTEILPAHITGAELPQGFQVETYVETGLVDGQSTRHAPQRYVAGVNIGKKNYRTPLQKALIDTRDAFIKRQETGGRLTAEEAKQSAKPLNTNATDNDLTDQNCPPLIRYYPMLAHNYKDSKSYAKWPAYIQPKLDGVRCVTCVTGPGDDCEVVHYSRKLNDFTSIPHIARILKPYLQDLYDQDQGQSIYLDGELYEHGVALQEITGQVRQQDPSKVTRLLTYHIYDCFYPLELDTPYKTRLAQLEILREAVDRNPEDATYVKFVPTRLVSDEAAAQIAFKEFTAASYEGAMLRNMCGVYLADPNRSSTRSRDLLKMKFKETAEFKIVGFTEGKGRDAGAILWQLETKKGERFTCTPKNADLAERRELYAKCLRDFQTTYLGRQMTVEYESLSNRGVPLRGKAVNVRDYE